MKKEQTNYKRFISIFTSSQHSFEGKLPDENVYIVVRKHWFVLLQRMVVIVFLVVGSVFITSSFADLLFNADLVMFVWFLTFLFYLYIWYALFFQIMLYLMDIWIITDHRIIDSQQYWLFSRGVSELDLKNIQDITVEINGFFPTLLNFGNLEIQTAGTTSRFYLSGVANPIAVKNLIMKAQRDNRKMHPKGKED